MAYSQQQQTRGGDDFSAGVDARPTEKATSFIQREKKEKESFFIRTWL
jgi:hypothetical protein